MDHVRGAGGYSSSNRWRQKNLSRQGKKALAALEPESQKDLLVQVHQESESLRRLAEHLRVSHGFEGESYAEFSFDADLGEVVLHLMDVKTGEFQLKLSLEEVSKALQDLEESSDEDLPLSSFFLDIKV